MLRKARAHAEIYNDLDTEVVTLFRVLRDPIQSLDLVRLLRLTPFARAEFEGSYCAADEAVEIARRLLIRSFMGFGSNAHATTNSGRAQTGFRGSSSRSGTTPAHDWAHYPDSLVKIIERLAGVTVECRPAIDVMRQHDGPKTLHYVDPPYLLSLRNPGNPYDRKHMYRHEMSDDDHAQLLADLKALAGMVVLSGYPSDLYDAALTDWRRVERPAMADGARPRTEVLWLNPACAAALGEPRQAEIFAEAAE